VTRASAGLQYHPLITPVRSLDTRVGEGGYFTPGTPITGGTSRIQPRRNTCTIPNSAIALLGNITTVALGEGYLAFFPGSVASPPLELRRISTAHKASAATSLWCWGQAMALLRSMRCRTELVVDVSGYFAP
jgi:hypothetical protein